MALIEQMMLLFGIHIHSIIMNFPKAFTDALAFTLKWEGGYSNNIHDAGGATNFGVTHTVYDTYRHSKHLPFQNVKNITPEEVNDIYYNSYWKQAKCEAMTPKIAMTVFDFAVNSGVGRAVKKLQTAIGAEPDGDFGAHSMQLLQNKIAQSSKVSLASHYLQLRIDFLTSVAQANPKNKTFLKGWLNRVNDLKKLIISAPIV